MHLDLQTGRVDAARFVGSPNSDPRPATVPVDTLVIHSISLPPGQYGGCFVEEFFCNRLDPAGHEYFSEIQGLEVSAHFFIRRDGELIQFVPTDQRAWHAGESRLNGRERVNDFSVGIEIEGTDQEPFAEVQYEVLAELTRCLMLAYPRIQAQRIVGHQDIAPDRKSDPGPFFDWSRYRSAIA